MGYSLEPRVLGREMQAALKLKEFRCNEDGNAIYNSL